MKSRMHEKSGLEIEITNISSHGIWLFVRGKALFLSYEDFHGLRMFLSGKY